MISSKSSKYYNNNNSSSIRLKKSTADRHDRPKSSGFGGTNAPIMGFLNGTSYSSAAMRPFHSNGDSDTLPSHMLYPADTNLHVSHKQKTDKLTSKQPSSNATSMDAFYSQSSKPPPVPPHQSYQPASETLVKVAVEFNPILEPKVNMPSPLLHIPQRAEKTNNHVSKSKKKQLATCIVESAKVQSTETAEMCASASAEVVDLNATKQQNVKRRKGKSKLSKQRPQSCHISTSANNSTSMPYHVNNTEARCAFNTASAATYSSARNAADNDYPYLIKSSDCLEKVGMDLVSASNGYDSSSDCVMSSSITSCPLGYNVVLREKKDNFGIERLRSLRKRISTSFSRLSLSKDDTIPENEAAKVSSSSQRLNIEDLADDVFGKDRVRSDSQGNDEVDSAATQSHRQQRNFFRSLRKGMVKRHNSLGNMFGAGRSEPESSMMTQSMHAAPVHPSDTEQSDAGQSKAVLRRVHSDNRPHSVCLAGGSATSSGQLRRSGYFSGTGGAAFGRSDSYQRLEMLGEGSYASVFKGYSHLIGKLVALKEIRLQHDEGAPFTAIREASLLKGLKHANIVTLHDIVHTQDSLTLVFEYVQSDLSKYLEKHSGGLRPQNVKLYLYQLLRGLAFCHQRRILHRDLKPQNLLISDIGELKLADFGLARAKSVPSHTYSHEVVTLWYRPPDVLLGSTNYTTSLDMWGVGCIFTEMISGMATFPGMKDTDDQLERIFRVMGCPDESSWPGVSKLPNYNKERWSSLTGRHLHKAVPRLLSITHAEDLALSFLQLRPENRLLANSALRHEFFADLPLDELEQLPATRSIFTVGGVKMLPESPQRPANNFQHHASDLYHRD